MADPGYLADAFKTPDEDVFQMILMHISNGMPLKEALKLEGMPRQATFHAWINRNKEWMDAYLMAQESRMHALAEETIEIADNVNPKFVKKAELQTRTRQWMVERYAKKIFGDPRGVPAGPINVGHMTINNNTIHSLLTKGTELHHVVEVVPTQQLKEVHENGQDHETGPDNGAGVPASEPNHGDVSAGSDKA